MKAGSERTEGKRFSKRIRYADASGEHLTRDPFAVFNIKARRREALAVLKSKGIKLTTDLGELVRRVMEHPDYALDSELDLAAGIILAFINLNRANRKGFRGTWLPLNEAYRIGYLVGRREFYRADDAIRRTGQPKRNESAQTESSIRKRQWLTFRGAIRLERAFELLPAGECNAEVDKRLSKWLSERGKKVSAKTITNQRSKEQWRFDDD